LLLEPVLSTMATVRGKRRQRGIRALGLTVGIAVGAAVGVVTGDLSLWVTAGAVVGFAGGVLASRR
jgi:uncharacterized membrane protein YoaK (UPF0700 family)